MFQKPTDHCFREYFQGKEVFSALLLDKHNTTESASAESSYTVVIIQLCSVLSMMKQLEAIYSQLVALTD